MYLSISRLRATVRALRGSIAGMAVPLAVASAWMPGAPGDGFRIAGALALGLFVWWSMRPLARLQDCLQRLQRGQTPDPDQWPAAGPAGRLAETLQALDQRHVRQREASSQSLGRLQAVLDHAPVGIAFARNSTLELVSMHLARMFGREPDGMVQQPTSIMHASGEDRADFVAKARSLFDAHGGFDGETRLRHADGQVFWARMRGRAVQPGVPEAGTIWIIDDISNTREEQQRLAWAAEHDSLTGLFNRSGFDGRLRRVLDERTPFCALFIDLDRFKQVNDMAGHAAGDRLLVELAVRIADVVRDSDTVARIGGDEFALLLPQCPTPRALVIAETIRAAVDRYRLEWQGELHGVGASIGLVVGPGEFTSCATVLATADAACYEAKRNGRNRVVVVQPEPDTVAAP
jgi:diguanylate cyclase